MEVSRRGFVRLIGAAGGAATLGLVHAAPAEANPTTGARGDAAFVGTVESAAPDALRVRVGEELVDVNLAHATHVYAGAGGRSTDGTDFVVGDRVLVEGLRTPAGVAAIAVGSVLTPVSITVRESRAAARRLVTDLGTFELAGRLPDYDPFAAWDEVRPGTALEALLWVDPQTTVPHLLIPDPAGAPA